LRRIYKSINQKCPRNGDINIDDIVYTQKDVDIPVFIAFFTGKGDGFNRNFFYHYNQNPPTGWTAFNLEGFVINQYWKGIKARD